MYGIKLFSKESLRNFLEQRKAEMVKEIKNQKKARILNAGEELKEYFVNKYKLAIPKLHKEDKYSEVPKDTKIPSKRLSKRRSFGRNRPKKIEGTKYTIHIPFEGEKKLFKYQPSTTRLSFPKAKLKDGEIVLSYEMVDNDKKELEKRINKDLEDIEENLGNVRKDVSPFNKKLSSLIEEEISNRKDELLKRREVVEEIGIPLKKDEKAADTYSVPTKRKKPEYEKPEVDESSPQPILGLEEYKNILESVDSMAKVMERSPKTFAKLEEEEIRDHFLMMLNGIYKGEASGETFNGEGRTDILIRHDDQNVFIAECKIWRGSKKFNEAIEQLFSYTTWRDTKASIIVFNKNKKFSSVLEKIEQNLNSHECSIERINMHNLDVSEERIFSYKFNHPKDKNHTLYLTVMVFDVPGNS